jgi:DNA-binding transcriptional LysR family regulator
MELRQLEYFVAVAEEANFTRAAARLHVAQPGVSAQVRRLERELGQELLDRSGRSVRLTNAGAAVLPYARAALGAVAGARVVADELAGLVRGQVSVGMVVACASLDLTTLLASFHERHPGVEITLTEANSDRLIDALQDGQLDLAWVGAAGPVPKGIATHVLIDDPLVVAVNGDHRWADRSSIPLRDLRDVSLITLPLGTGIRSSLEMACAKAGFAPRVAFQASAPHIVAQLASEGLGVAVLPESVVAASARLRAVSIIRPRLRSRIELAWRASGPFSPAALALIDHARATFTAG